MGFLDKIFGTSSDDTQRTAPPAVPTKTLTDDERALERYRYLIRTAPPETIEKVHAEAFARLTPEQRALFFQQLSANSPEWERPATDQPADLARAATRAELRQPGTLERSLGGPSFGSMFASSLLGSVAGYVIASSLMSAFAGDGSSDTSNGDDSSQNDSSGDSSDSGADSSTDSGGYDSAGGYDGGGDFGGGDFGADFGGGFDF
jgi:hypothetical protein